MEADQELSDAFPSIQAAIVTIKTKDGEHTKRVDFPKGEPQNPLNEQEFRDRYNGLMGYAGQKNGDKIFDLVYKNANVRELMNNL